MPPITLVARVVSQAVETEPPFDPQQFAQRYRPRSIPPSRFGGPLRIASRFWWIPAPPCTMQWKSLAAVSADSNAPLVTHALQVHDGALFAAGIGGVLQWNPDVSLWQTLNDGFADPAWLDTPMIVSLASDADGLVAVMVNAAAQRLYRLSNGVVVWASQENAPDGARSLLMDGGTLYLGTTTGVYGYEPATASWFPLGQTLPSTVSTLATVDGELFAGTFSGDMARYDPFDAVWTLATAPLPATHVFACIRFGEYLYIGGYPGFARCWTETGMWDTASLCETIEPDTGFPSDTVARGFHVRNDTLYVATSKGVKQYDADNDQWLPLNAGLTDAAGLPLSVFSVTTFDNRLIAGTTDGVYQYGCWQ